MIARTLTIERGDPFAVRELKDLLDSRAFNIYLARIDRMIEDERRKLETADTLDRIRQAQGALQALRTVKKVPDILLAELTEKRK
jgi:hypothetical protein